MKELKVIQSTTEPKQTSVLWLSPEGLKRFTSKGWEVISGSSSGSGFRDTKKYDSDFNNDFA